MSRQSIIESIQGIEHTIEKLNELVHELNYRLVAEPDQILTDAVSAGFPIETEQNYRKGYLAKNEEDAIALINSIYRVHIPYLQSVIDHLKSALD